MSTTPPSKRAKSFSPFFSTSSPPTDLSTLESTLESFLNAPHARARVCLLTSGGTTAPLERKTVRFIDNFSTGARGAKLCELFLKNNIRVVFLHRESGEFPFFSKLKKQKGEFLRELASGKVPEEATRDAQKFAEHVEEKDLLCVPFTSVSEYLYKLRACAHAVDSKHATIVLAAAVSDFYIPDSEMNQHKIQSSGDDLVLNLRPVPKLLGELKLQWAPNSYCVSFKLETDEDILIKKAYGAIEKYSMDLVVANELDTRYEKVVFVEKGESDEPILTTIRKPISQIVEVPLVDALLERMLRRNKD